MSMLFQLRTPRLLLRHWQASDYAPFSDLNRDAEVMRYFPNPLSQAESIELADRISAGLSERGWGFWAAELRESNEFLGFIGLSHNASTPQGKILETGWRLKQDAWGRGYATEGAKAALVFAFEILKLAEVFALTSTGNDRSRAVMERLGMVNIENNFMHPKIADGDPLQEHVLYRVTAKEFRTSLPVEIETINRKKTAD